MALIEWKVDLETGLESIDDQHKKLIEVFNELLDVVQTGQPQEIQSDCLIRLSNYTGYHFKTEEDYFRMIDYPDAAGHIIAHKSFIDQINEFQMLYDAGQIELSPAVLNSLGRWLVSHIQGIDRQFVTCVKKNAA